MINVQEIKNPDLVARLFQRALARLERRVSFRISNKQATSSHSWGKGICLVCWSAYGAELLDRMVQRRAASLSTIQLILIMVYEAKTMYGIIV